MMCSMFKVVIRGKGGLVSSFDLLKGKGQRGSGGPYGHRENIDTSLKFHVMYDLEKIWTD